MPSYNKYASSCKTAFKKRSRSAPPNAYAQKKMRMQLQPYVPRGVTTASNINRFQRLRYCENFAMDPGAGTIIKHIFCANGIVDPSVTGGGTAHQPMRLDTLTTIFNHYVVISSKCTVRKVGVLPTTSNPSTPVVWGVYLDDDEAALPTYTTLIESGKTPFRISNTSNADVSQMLSNTFDAKKFFKVSNVADNVDRLGAAVNANPTEKALYTVWAQAQNVTDDPISEQYIIVIDYLVMFSEVGDLPAS